jgi:hypothetical protein
MIAGWSNYYSAVVSKAIFQCLDHQLYVKLARWARNRNLATVHRLIEEPCASKGAHTVLRTSEGSDPLAGFNWALRSAVISSKVSQCSKKYRGTRAFAAFTSMVRTLTKQGIDALSPQR